MTSQHLTPVELPEKDLVIYDGHCQFCRKQIKRLQRLDGKNRLAFLSLHDPQVSRYAPNLTHEQMMEQMFIVDRTGRQYGGAAAFRYLTCRLPRLWSLAPLLHIPFSLPIWQWLYRQVAVRRYRWNTTACENGSCRLHSGKG